MKYNWKDFGLFIIVTQFHFVFFILLSRFHMQLSKEIYIERETENATTETFRNGKNNKNKKIINLD